MKSIKNIFLFFILFIHIAPTSTYAQYSYQIDCSTGESYNYGVRNLINELASPYHYNGQLVGMRLNMYGITTTPREGVVVRLTNVLGVGNNIRLLVDPGSIYIVGFISTDANGDDIYYMLNTPRGREVTFEGQRMVRLGVSTSYIDLMHHAGMNDVRQQTEIRMLDADRVRSGINDISRTRSLGDITQNSYYALMSFAFMIGEGTRFRILQELTSHFLEGGSFIIDRVVWGYILSWGYISGQAIGNHNYNIHHEFVNINGIEELRNTIGTLYGCDEGSNKFKMLDLNDNELTCENIKPDFHSLIDDIGINVTMQAILF